MMRNAAKFSRSSFFVLKEQHRTQGYLLLHIKMKESDDHYMKFLHILDREGYRPLKAWGWWALRFYVLNDDRLLAALYAADVEAELEPLLAFCEITGNHTMWKNRKKNSWPHSTRHLLRSWARHHLLDLWRERHYYRVIRAAKGLGIAAVSSRRYLTGPGSHLRGFVEFVPARLLHLIKPDEDWSKPVKGFDSHIVDVLQDRRNNPADVTRVRHTDYVQLLNGPVSLINHDCEAPAGAFWLPDVKEREAGERYYQPPGDVVIFEDKLIRRINSKEVFCHYGSVDFHCLCPKCVRDREAQKTLGELANEWSDDEQRYEDEKERNKDGDYRP